MRQRVYKVFIVVMLVVGTWLVLPFLWEATTDTYYTVTNSIVDRYVRWSDARPPRPMPERKGDRERYPRRGFGLELQYSRGFRVDTFLGLATKDMIGEPDTTIALRLSDAQLDTLYEAVIGMRLFDFSGPTPPFHWKADESNSERWARLTVRAGSSRKVLEWSAEYWRPRPMPDEWKRFVALERTIGRMVMADPGFRALPRPKGVYTD